MASTGQITQEVPGVGHLFFASRSSKRTLKSDQPLAILFPWLGANVRNIRHYVQLYIDKGTDVLAIFTDVNNFLNPSKGKELCRRVLTFITQDQQTYTEFFIHGFSVGCFTLTLCSILCNEKPDKYVKFKDSVSGIILDSPTLGSVENMARGIAKSNANSAITRWCIFRGVMFFFKCSPGTVSFYEDSIEHIFQAPFDKPALFFSSKNDPMCNFPTLENLVENWKRKVNHRVVFQFWENSVHTAHFLHHTSEYIQAFDDFCQTIPNFFTNGNTPDAKL